MVAAMAVEVQEQKYNSKNQQQQQQQQQQQKDIDPTVVAADVVSGIMLHQQTEAQLDDIAHTVKVSQPLTSELKSLSELKIEYSSSGGCGSSSNTDNNSSSNNSTNRFFLLGIDDLIHTKGYTHYRTTRGDGNCFYRAVLYQLCDKIYHHQQQQLMMMTRSDSTNTSTNTTTNSTNNKNVEEEDDIHRLYKFIKDQSLQYVTTIGGYDETTIEIFYDSIVELFDQLLSTTTTIPSSSSSSPIDIHTLLNEESSISDYCIWYLRVLAASYCKSDPNRFVPYILGEQTQTQVYHDDNGMDDTSSEVIVSSYCRSCIEPVGSEASMVSIVALSEVLHLPVMIAYLDGHEFITTTTTNNSTVGITQHTFGPTTPKKEAVSDKINDNQIHITLLYRPGHYDILY
jgi:ubiquitin thioesterase protein OTUB1